MELTAGWYGKGKGDDQPYRAYAIGRCVLCEAAFLENKAENLMHARERKSRRAPAFYIVHARCFYLMPEMEARARAGA